MGIHVYNTQIFRTFLSWAYMYTTLKYLGKQVWFKQICPNLTKGYSQTYIWERDRGRDEDIQRGALTSFLVPSAAGLLEAAANRSPSSSSSSSNIDSIFFCGLDLGAVVVGRGGGCREDGASSWPKGRRNWVTICCNKPNFVITTVLSRHAYFCCNKHMFVAQKLSFVMTKVRLSQQKSCLSWQKMGFVATDRCHDKHIFVMTKHLSQQMKLVAAPASDRSSYQDCPAQQTGVMTNMFLSWQNICRDKWNLWQLPPEIGDSSVVRAPDSW